MKAIKKPVTVNCWLITQKELDKIWDKKKAENPDITSFGTKLHGAGVWLLRRKKNEYDKRQGYGEVIARIRTLEGYMDLKAGDYLIKGVVGEFYPCRADIFNKTYKLCQIKL
jgi:hypothetical protein